MTEYISSEEAQAKIAELREELAAANLVIEQMCEWIVEASHRIWCMRLDPYDERDHGCTCGKEELTAQPSTNFLKQRDRKRDAALLRKIAEDFDDEIERVFLTHASIRESGEWEPEL